MLLFGAVRLPRALLYGVREVVKHKLIHGAQTTPDEDHSMNTWTSHLDGARMLLRMRGSEMLREGSTYRLFALLRYQIVSHCQC